MSKSVKFDLKPKENTKKYLFKNFHTKFGDNRSMLKVFFISPKNGNSHSKLELIQRVSNNFSLLHVKYDGNPR